MAIFTTKKLAFTRGDNSLVGELILPRGVENPPVVVVTGAWTTVKEQMPTVYAHALAARGYGAFVFDFTGWGESEGKNRFLEHPTEKTEDIKAAVGFLATRDEIDTSRIGGLGVCASAGYMVKAFAELSGKPEQSKLKTIGLVAPWLHDTELATEVYGGEASINALAEAGEAARERFEQTGAITTIEGASKTNTQSLMQAALYYSEPDRGQIPEYDNRFNLASWMPWLSFDALSLAEKLPGKVTFVHSEAAAIPHGVKAFAERAGDKVEGVWLENVSQFDFYDHAEPVRLAADAIEKHFRAHL